MPDNQYGLPVPQTIARAARVYARGVARRCQVQSRQGSQSLRRNPFRWHSTKRPPWHRVCVWSARSICLHQRDKSSEFWHRDILGGFSPACGLKPILDRTGEQKLHQALIAPPSRSLQKILTVVNVLDFK